MGAVSLPNWSGHSALVNTRLLVAGNSVRVVQMGRDFLVVDQPFDHPPTDARLLMQVDHSEKVWEVLLPKGISSSSKRVPIAARV